MVRFIFILLTLAAVLAFLSKPDERSVRDQATALIREAIASGNLDDVADPALRLALIGCKTDPASCASLLMQGVSLTYDDRVLYARVDATGFQRTATCYAAYTRLFCPQGLIRRSP